MDGSAFDNLLWSYILFLVLVFLLGAATGIGIEHLSIYLGHHIHWSK